jgi:hypothetical protein
MQKQPQKKLIFEFPAEEYVFLKMACAKQGISMKEFITKSVIRSIDEYETYLDSLSLKEISDDERKNAQPWEEVKKELGWDKL